MNNTSHLNPRTAHLAPRTSKVIGVGNIFRRDDSVGVFAVQRLLEMDLPGVTVEEASGEGGDLMLRWKDVHRVILIDATRSGAEPGTIHRLDASSEKIPSSFFHYSTHAFSVAEAIEMARVLDELPPEVLVFGIEGLDFSTGEGLTQPVADALDTVIESVLSSLEVA